ncbi:hypothetical protein BD410DRAFT_828752 [Rickenella mellea]|uniref:Uncharacterized protein n=1 Tax=Rickenella mellea TaxID=50990 RepID=A0A4Y7Q549_9AGAM|nr:hypothetical protein BD410DRAFT_828752 [Rickenella mellea]
MGLSQNDDARLFKLDRELQIRYFQETKLKFKIGPPTDSNLAHFAKKRDNVLKDIIDTQYPHTTAHELMFISGASQSCYRGKASRQQCPQRGPNGRLHRLTSSQLAYDESSYYRQFLPNMTPSIHLEIGPTTLVIFKSSDQQAAMRIKREGFGKSTARRRRRRACVLARSRAEAEPSLISFNGPLLQAH